MRIKPYQSIFRRFFKQVDYCAGCETATPACRTVKGITQYLSHDSSVGEWMYLTVCPLCGPGHDSSVGEWMYLTVCPLCGPGSISSRGGVSQGTFSWLLRIGWLEIHISFDANCIGRQNHFAWPTYDCMIAHIICIALIRISGAQPIVSPLSCDTLDPTATSPNNRLTN